jgi:hypothetical protein
LADLDAALEAEERDPATLLSGEERSDDPEPLLEPAHTMVGRIAEGLVLRVEPAGPDAENQTASADGVGRRRHLREEGRVAEQDAHDELALLDAIRRRGQRGDDRPRLVDAHDRPTGRTGQEVVADQAESSPRSSAFNANPSTSGQAGTSPAASERDIGTVTPILTRRSLAAGRWNRGRIG